MSTVRDDHDDYGRRLERGDEEALAAFFELHRERLWRMVSFRLDRRLHGRVDPDDVLQEGYLAAAQRLKHYGGETDAGRSPFVWLRLVVIQTMIDVHRKHLGAQMRDADREVAIQGCVYPLATSASIAIHLVGNLTSPSRAALRAEMIGRVEEAIEKMDRVDQEILALRHFEELSNSEVAEVLGIQQKAASIRYVRAIRRLKANLSHVPGLFEDDKDG